MLAKIHWLLIVGAKICPEAHPCFGGPRGTSANRGRGGAIYPQGMDMGVWLRDIDIMMRAQCGCAGVQKMSNAKF